MSPISDPDPVYATVADYNKYVTDSALADPAVSELLDRAQRDIDHAAGAWPVADTTRGLKFAPASLPSWQAAALARATCAQAEYRETMGDEFMIKAQHSRVSGPDFSVEGELPYIGPQALRELASGGLLRSGPALGYASVPMGPGVTYP